MYVYNRAKYLFNVDTLLYVSYTEKKERNRSTYYYRVRSYREGDKVSKKRKYLGKDLNEIELGQLEREADRDLHVLRNPC